MCTLTKQTTVGTHVCNICCIYGHIIPPNGNFNLNLTMHGRTHGRTDGRTDGPKDGKGDQYRASLRGPNNKTVRNVNSAGYIIRVCVH
jgi:hypothetical protein